MLKKIKLFVLVFLHLGFAYGESKTDTDVVQFIDSFLRHYEFGMEGRYVHEYHPFVLRKTRESFLSLEDALYQKNLSIEGRVVILGYEEQGVPTYYTDFTKPKIDDEAMIKSKAGWSAKLHNRFGFMTGFLLKDVNRLVSTCAAVGSHIFEHINAEEQLLFNDRAVIFQEHAFGQARPLIIRTKNKINELIKQGASKEILRRLIPFWETLYKGELKVGNSQIAGTQDILFSIEYGRYVLASTTPLRRCFLGADITYPIEIFAKQKKGVTRNSQAFVKSFVPNLQPIDNEPTVYIFCSFVDGVGKSTMLGNIKNWMKHGPNVNLYDHVDNSSSQLAEIFQFKDNVFIADLPAQLSHFTYKPDGMVYVDVRTEFSEKEYNLLDRYVIENKQQLIADYSKKLMQMRFDSMKNPQLMLDGFTDPAEHFLRNIILLKKDRENVWAPCSFNDKSFLFNINCDGEYRVLLPLGKAKSEGLKNVESEQMLFTDGVRFPLPYKDFVNDLVSRLKEAGVQKVVFVDFLSMYPRSSRENIRVNYLLQQLALLDADFNIQQSMYRNFTSGGELLYCLLQKNISDKILHSMELEALVRWHLFSMIKDRKEGDLSGYSSQMLTEKLKVFIGETKSNQNVYGHLKKSLQAKISSGKRKLEEEYGTSKSFVNVQLFSMKDAASLYYALQSFMANNIENSVIERVWDDVGLLSHSSDLERFEQGFCDNCELVTTQGKKVRVLYKIHETCRSEPVLTPFLRMIRLSWLTSIFCLFGGDIGDEKTFKIDDLMFPHVPIHLVQGHDGYWFLIQEVFEPLEFNNDSYPPFVSVYSRLCGISLKDTKIGMCLVNDTACLITPSHVPTNVGIFDYDCTLSREKVNYAESAMTKLVRKLQKDASVNVVTPLIDAYRGLTDVPTFAPWTTDQRAVAAKMKNRITATPEEPCSIYRLLRGQYDTQKTAASSTYIATMPVHRSLKDVFIGASWQEDVIRYVLRLWFTLDMIIKDPDSELVVRLGNKLDFAASVTLLEAFIMPKYFGVAFEHNLFPDYETIEYFPSNEYWPHIQPSDE